MRIRLRKGKLHFLSGPSIYCCNNCRTHLGSHDHIISKAFSGQNGRAFLFHEIVNVVCGPAEERMLMTGLHVVKDIFCDACHYKLGWKYELAAEPSQKYKEGRYIVEKSLTSVVKQSP